MGASTQGNKTIPQLATPISSPSQILFHGWDPNQPIGFRDVAVSGSSLATSFSSGVPTETFTSGVDFTPNVTTTLNLLNVYGSSTNIEVHFDGTYQGPENYSLSARVLTFTSAIPLGVQKVYVKGVLLSAIGTPGAGTVTDASIAAGTKLINRIASVNALDYGVDPTGVADSTTALRNAIAALPATGGIVDCSLCPVIKVSSTITIGNGTNSTVSTINNVFLLGAGGGGPFATTSGTKLLWSGGAGGTVIQFLGGMTGGGLMGGWVIDGGGVASNGLILNHLEGGQFPRLKIQRCTGVYLFLTTQTNPDPVGGCRNNRFGVYSTDTLPSGSTGINLDGILTIQGDILQNVFDVVDLPMSGTGAIGIRLGYCNFNEFRIVDIGEQTTHVSSVGVKLVGTGPIGNTLFPCLNRFGQLASSCGIVTDSSGGTPYGNYIEMYDLPDSAATVPTAIGVFGSASGYNASRLENVFFGYVNPGWDTTTPSVPVVANVSAAVTNTNFYPVTIYHSTAVGAPTGIHIIDQHGNDQAFAADPPSITLYPGEKIYYTGSLPISWLWYGLAK